MHSTGKFVLLSVKIYLIATCPLVNFADENVECETNFIMLYICIAKKIDRLKIRHGIPIFNLVFGRITGFPQIVQIASSELHGHGISLKCLLVRVLFYFTAITRRE